MATLDEVIRAYFGASSEATISHEMSVYQAQPGCDTCSFGEDYDISIIIRAYEPGRHGKRLTETFDSLPELWKALA